MFYNKEALLIDPVKINENGQLNSVTRYRIPGTLAIENCLEIINMQLLAYQATRNKQTKSETGNRAPAPKN
jgi:hypothetical protein